MRLPRLTLTNESTALPPRVPIPSIPRGKRRWSSLSCKASSCSIFIPGFTRHVILGPGVVFFNIGIDSENYLHFLIRFRRESVTSIRVVSRVLTLHNGGSLYICKHVLGRFYRLTSNVKVRTGFQFVRGSSIKRYLNELRGRNNRNGRASESIKRLMNVRAVIHNEVVCPPREGSAARKLRVRILRLKGCIASVIGGPIMNVLMILPRRRRREERVISIQLRMVNHLSKADLA